MKFNAIVIALLLIAMCACGETQKANSKSVAISPTPVPTIATPKDGDYPAKGVVTKINTEIGSVELNHGDIPGVMPPMQMEFFVSDKKILDGLKVGDNVDFVLRYKHPTETIVQITKAK
jgi:Cu(I)/Ag(I) efflux system periplasmic protein CusF